MKTKENIITINTNGEKARYKHRKAKEAKGQLRKSKEKQPENKGTADENIGKQWKTKEGKGLRNKALALTRAKTLRNHDFHDCHDFHDSPERIWTWALARFTPGSHESHEGHESHDFSMFWLLLGPKP